MATHSSILARKIPSIEEAGGLQTMALGAQSLNHWTTREVPQSVLRVLQFNACWACHGLLCDTVGVVFFQRHQGPDGGEVCRAWTGNDTALMLEAGGGWKDCAHKGTRLKR